MNPDFISVEQMLYKTPVLLKNYSAAAGFAVSVMRARDTECPWWSGESCFTASKATLTRMVIRQN